MSRRARRQGGMTVIEIALAIGILAVMGTLTYGAIGRSFDIYEAVRESDARYHNVRVAMERMTREISMAFLTQPSRNFGQELMWETIFIGRPASPFYELNFTSLAHVIMRKNAKESDQCEIGYYGERDEEDPDILNLMRREDPRIDTEPDEGGKAYVMAENVKDFKMRFFDPTNDDWVDEWDTEDPEFVGRLPTIVELTLVIEDESGEEVKFLTKTRINIHQALPRF